MENSFNFQVKLARNLKKKQFLPQLKEQNKSNPRTSARLERST